MHFSKVFRPFLNDGFLPSTTSIFITLLLGHSRSSTPFREGFLKSVALFHGSVQRMSNITPGRTAAKALEQLECGHKPFLIATGLNIWLSRVLS